MAVGIAGLYVVFQQVGTSVGTWSLALPLLLFGLGMGMIFVPLFGIILGDVEDSANVKACAGGTRATSANDVRD